MLSPEVHRRFRVAAAQEGKGMSRQAKELVERFVDESERERKTDRPTGR
jgi:hypothetical protein